MDIKLTFLGAAGNVTGSRYLVEANDKRIMIDCGYFQEWKFKKRNWDEAFIPAESIDMLLLTHAHLDHCGLIPRIVKHGFSGDILCTSSTAEIAKIIMTDSAKIQEEDVKYKILRHKKKGVKSDKPIEALYEAEDAKAASSLFKIIELKSPREIAPGIVVEYQEAGHILGACSIKMTITQNNEYRTIVFSGDIGRNEAPILRDPEPFDAADYLLIESTYGNRVHEDTADIPSKLEEVVNDTSKAGGNIVIPTFAVERSQDLLYHLSGLLHEKRIPPLIVFLDSPMASKVTDTFINHPELFDEETMDLLDKGLHPCDFPALFITKTVDQSKAINRIKGSCIILAGSGMCTGGRIKHHIQNNIGNESSTILFVGYQAEGTLGRQLLEGDKEIRLFGEMQEVKCKVDKINGFSGHADRDELLDWARAIKKPPRKTFIVHGEKSAAEAMQQALESEVNFRTHLPEYRETVTLS